MDNGVGIKCVGSGEILRNEPPILPQKSGRVWCEADVCCVQKKSVMVQWPNMTGKKYFIHRLKSRIIFVTVVLF